MGGGGRDGNKRRWVSKGIIVNSRGGMLVNAKQQDVVIKRKTYVDHVILLNFSQNLDVRFSGGAVLGAKVDGSKTQKKGGGLGSRKALNDISNSAKPTAFQMSKKHNNNVIAIDRDTGAATKTPFAVRTKPPGSKVPQKGKSGGRKALSDLTNTGKSSLQHVANKSQDKKLSVFSEEIVIEEEGFLHNHQECCKARRNIMDKDSFLGLVGLDEPPFVPPASEFRSPEKLLEMEEMSVPSFDADQVLNDWRVEYPGVPSPASLSPDSPRLSDYWNSLCEDKFPDFKLIESPKH